MRKLFLPLSLGWLALGLAFMSGLNYHTLWIAAIALGLQVFIIGLTVKMSNDLGAIEVLKDLADRRKEYQ